jgi:ribonuclease III
VSEPAVWAKAYLDYVFEDCGLLELALTHRSASKANYERLEFLGDAYLNYVIAEQLYLLRPDYAEGDLSRARAALVNGPTLTQMAREIRLDSQVIVGPGERRTGGMQRASVLADAIEAVVGAVLLDGGPPAARDLILKVYGDRIRTLPDSEKLKDAKTRLQEWLQARGRPLPSYEVIEVSGRDHEKTFGVSCALSGGDSMSTVGHGRSRRRAEQAAAELMLTELRGE